MATKQQVVVIAQDPEGPENSPDVFTSHKKAITGMSIAMIVLGVLSVIFEVNLFCTAISLRAVWQTVGYIAFCPKT